MASTNYRSYTWLLNILKEHEKGLTLKKLNELYSIEWRKWEEKENCQKNDGVRKGIEYLSNVTLLNWRQAIYKEFGVIIVYEGGSHV